MVPNSVESLILSIYKLVNITIGVWRMVLFRTEIKIKGHFSQKLQIFSLQEGNFTKKETNLSLHIFHKS